MKKYLSILLCLALCASMAACSSSEPAPEPEEPAVSGEPEDQVKLIAENKDLWLVTDVNEADQYQYAVTDLDENGRLELISTVMEGTGRFSTTRFYEVSEDFSKLEPVEYDLDGAQSEADLGWTGSFRSYKGELGNFVVASDQMSNGYAENYYYEDFSYCLVLAEDSNGDGEPELHAYYYASGDEEEELTPEAFARSADDFFGYAYDRYVMDLSWKQFDEAARKSEVDIPAGLADSWSGFGFRKSTQEFESLFVAPSSYYDELYENGEKAAITYGMESLPDYWTLQEISTELEARNAIEDGIDCHMIIGQDGIEGMPLAMAEDGMGDPAESEDGEGNGADWMVVFSTEDGLERFEATIGPEDGRLYVTWYWWSEEDPGADPVIEKMVFTNGVG